MKLEEMKDIAKARTSGDWEAIRASKIYQYDNVFYSITPDVETPAKAISDSQFISMAANNWDKLIEVAEAAKNAVS